MKRVLISLITFVFGGVILGVVVFANKIGIDHNVHWGRGRMIGASAGILIMIFALIISLYFDDIAAWIQKTLNLIKTQQPRNDLARHRTKLIYISAGFIGIVVLIIYVWFISVGTWTSWPKTQDYRDYFNQLGNAFDHGELYIQTKPTSDLLSLSNPYDPIARKHIPQADTLNNIWDLSLYNGKLYLYWGPIPALIIAVIKLFLPIEIADPYLVFAFTLGLFLFQSLLIIKLWSDFFSRLPAWTILMPIFLGGLVNPIPWLLSQPRIYEEAIVCGQFFFIAGIYFAYAALSKPSPSKPLMAMSGIFWVGAIGSRAFLFIPIAFLVFMILLRLCARNYRLQKITSETLFTIIAFGLPLLIGGILLGWYNWARFGSVFEFGFRYQITMLDLNKYNNDIFSLADVPINLYVYFLNPPDVINTFPFIKPSRAGDGSFLYNHLPALYATEHITGPLYAFPFIVFGIVSILTIGSKRLSEILAGRRTESQPEFYRWFLLSLIGSLPFALSSLLLFFYAAQRYMEDVIPLTFLIAALGFWQGYSLLNKNLFRRLMYSFIAVILAGISIISSILLSFSADVARIRSANPSLLTNLILFFLKLKKLY